MQACMHVTDFGHLKSDENTLLWNGMECLATLLVRQSLHPVTHSRSVGLNADAVHVAAAEGGGNFTHVGPGPEVIHGQGSADVDGLISSVFDAE